MTRKKINYPYYAKWWFFLCLIFLNWITPITSNWKIYIFGKRTEANLVRIYDEEIGGIVWKYIFKYNDYFYFSEYKEILSSQEMPLKVIMYFNDETPSENFIGAFEYFYFGEKLIFPILFQILMIVFFFLVRIKEY